MQKIEDFEVEAKVRMKWLNYKGKEILVDDYTNLYPEQFAPIVKIIANLTLESGKKDILCIVDESNSYANKDAVNAFVEAGKISKNLLTKTAVVGITGVKKIFLNIVNKISGVNAKTFATLDEAKEWLVN
jgi:hypothetical protein